MVNGLEYSTAQVQRCECSQVSICSSKIIANKRGVAHISLTSIQPAYKRGVAHVLLYAKPLLLAIILARANAYSRALATLRLSGTVLQ